MERTEGLEFSDVVGIRCECQKCCKHYTIREIRLDLLTNFIRCPLCTGLPADRPVPVALNDDQRKLVDQVVLSLNAVRELAAAQSSEPKPAIKLSLEVRSKA